MKEQGENYNLWLANDLLIIALEATYALNFSPQFLMQNIIIYWMATSHRCWVWPIVWWWNYGKIEVSYCYHSIWKYRQKKLSFFLMILMIWFCIIRISENVFIYIIWQDQADCLIYNIYSDFLISIFSL